MDRNRIVIDNIVFSIQKIGGVSVVWYEIIKRMLCDKRYICEFVECEDATENYYRKDLSIPKLNIKIFVRKWYKIIRYINLKLGIKEPYIFHSSYYRISRDKTAINFTTVHDFVYEKSNSKSFATKIHIWQQRQAVLKSDYVICISENTKKDLLYYYEKVDPNKIHVVYNGVSNEYKQLLSLEDVELPFKPQAYCIYVGVRSSYKNYNLAVEALSKTNYNLVIVGGYLSEEEKVYLDSTLGIGRYACESKIPNERLNQLYNGAFALLYLSSYEGFGIPCLEAQKAGCPVVALNSSSMPEVVCDLRLLIDTPTVENVISKIINLEEVYYRKEIIKKGVDFARRFSWDRCYRELTDLYKKALYDARQNSSY